MPITGDSEAITPRYAEFSELQFAASPGMGAYFLGRGRDAAQAYESRKDRLVMLNGPDARAIHDVNQMRERMSPTGQSRREEKEEEAASMERALGEVRKFVDLLKKAKSSDPAEWREAGQYIRETLNRVDRVVEKLKLDLTAGLVAIKEQIPGINEESNAVRTIEKLLPLLVAYKYERGKMELLASWRITIAELEALRENLSASVGSRSARREGGKVEKLISTTGEVADQVRILSRTADELLSHFDHLQELQSAGDDLISKEAKLQMA